MLCSSSLALVTGLAHSAKDQMRIGILNRLSTAALSASAGGSAVPSTAASPGIGQLVRMELLSLALDMVRQKADEYGSSRLKRFFQELVFSRLLQQDIAYFEDPNRSAYDLRRCVEASKVVVDSLVQTPLHVIESATRVVTTLVMMWRQNPRLTRFLVGGYVAHAGLEWLVAKINDANLVRFALLRTRCTCTDATCPAQNVSERIKSLPTHLPQSSHARCSCRACHCI